jgi:hypothetical protein
VTRVVQADIESRTRTWSLTDDEGAASIPTAIRFIVRGVGGDTTFGTTGSSTDVPGSVVDNGDGTGTWRLDAGDLAVGQYEWWALATIDGEDVIPRRLSGKMEIRDR